jgi:hypothetical protein
MVTFFSNGGMYAVECPPGQDEDTRAYVHAVEGFIPALKEVLSPLRPSFERFTVIFGGNGPSYSAGGLILLRASMDLHSEENRYGGLFHETVHGFVEKYIHRPNGTNVHPSEALPIILQVAALYKVNATWASKYRDGHGSCNAVHPWLNELARIYGDAGIEPIRAIFREMGDSTTPVFRSKETYATDVNRLWERLGFSCTLAPLGTGGLTDS